MKEIDLESLSDSVGLPVEALTAYELLDEKELHHLAEALQQARQRQSAALEVAIQQALSHVPKLLRGPILKILGH